MPDASPRRELRAAHTAPAPSSPSDYPSLLQLLKARGCLDKQRGYYLGKMLLNLALLAASITALVAFPHPTVQCLNAVFLGFVYVQIGMIVHDLGHHQVFRAPRVNDLVGILNFNLLLGVSYHYWLHKHTAHHRHPNELDHDPDIAFPFAYCPEQAGRATGLHRFLVRHQAVLFLPVISLGLWSIRWLGVRFLMRRPWKGGLLLEVLLTPLHYALYLGLLFAILPPGYAILFVLIHHATAGVYLGLVFATNHMGMPILDDGPRASHLYRQVTTARNIASHPVTDYLFGPLGCQIEHHLFPTIPVNMLRRAQNVVRPFCAVHSIPYHETTAVQAVREVLQHLHRIGRGVR